MALSLCVPLPAPLSLFGVGDSGFRNKAGTVRKMFYYLLFFKKGDVQVETLLPNKLLVLPSGKQGVEAGSLEVLRQLLN